MNSKLTKKTNVIKLKTMTSRLSIGINSEKNEQENFQKTHNEELTEFLRNNFKIEPFFELSGNSEFKLPITFFSKKPEKWKTEFTLFFENFLDCEDIKINLFGRSIETPLRMENNLYDFKVVLRNEIYREEIKIFNHSDKTMKVHVELPDVAKKILKFQPIFSFIGPNSSFKFYIKLFITKDAPMHKLINFKRGEDYFKNIIYRIPCKFTGSGQELSLPFDIIFRFCHKQIQIPSNLNFGLLYKNTSQKKKIKITNTTGVLHQIVFEAENEFIDVDFGMGEVSIPPNCSRDIYFTFNAYNEGAQSHSVNYKIIMQEKGVSTGTITCSAEVFKCDLEFSALKLDFPRIQVNEMFTHSFLVRNVSQKSLQIQFLIPPFCLSGLEIFPKFKILNSNQSVNISVRFNSFFRIVAFENYMKRLKLKQLKLEKEISFKNIDDNHDLLELHLKDIDSDIDEANNLEIEQIKKLENSISKSIPEEKEKQFVFEIIELLNKIKQKISLSKYFQKNSGQKCLDQLIDTYTNSQINNNNYDDDVNSGNNDDVMLFELMSAINLSKVFIMIRCSSFGMVK